MGGAPGGILEVGEVCEIAEVVIWNEEGGDRMGGGLCEEVRRGRICEGERGAHGVL